MEELQQSNDAINATADALSYLSVSTEPNIKYQPMPDPLSVYVPLNSLTDETITSIVSTVQQFEKKDWNNSRRTLLAFLLAINERVSKIERNENSDKKFNQQTIQLAASVRQRLVEKDQYGQNKELNWDELRDRYNKMISEEGDGMAKHFQVDHFEPYYELIIKGLHPDIERSREYMARFRRTGWEPNELKIYWNVEQLENLCPKPKSEIKKIDEKKNTQLDGENDINHENKDESNDGAKQELIGETKGEENEVKLDDKGETKISREIEEKDNSPQSYDPSDADAVAALIKNSVSQREHAVKITYVNKGIEAAVFDAPEDAQLIVLNFANERSPGGGYLRHAWAQEEIILFNSDGYRSLLDLKYGRMGGGYAIPEFGAAYVRDIRFFNKKTGKDRKADMLVSACYCLSGSPQLFANPVTHEEWIHKNVAKFRAFIAAAVANTIGDGSNTYLLLGPIGTGAFGNDVTEIGYVFRTVLSSMMMGSNVPIQNAFGNIWFVSTDQWKNELFEQIFRDDHIPEVD